MTAVKAAALIALLTACYTPSPGRRETTQVADDARVALAKLTPVDDSAKKREFDRHYAAAIDAYKRAVYAEAIAEFEAAYAVDAQPLLIFNIAQAYRKAGQLDQALAHYRDYLARDPSAEREHVTELIDETQRALAHKPN